MLFSFSGFVKQDKGRGRTLGYPTANIEIPQDFEEGIFVGEVLFDKSSHPALVFVGRALTFGEDDKKAEIFVLDFNEDLYGKELEINVYKKLRDNIKFGTKEELVAQMKEDEKQAREYFSSSSD